MNSTKPTQLVAIGSFLAFLSLCCFLSFEIFVASEREVSSTEIQKRLEITAQNVLVISHNDNPHNDLRLYAVNVIHTALPFRDPFVGYGVYLGQGMVLTAAHVVGRMPLVTHPRVLIAGMDLPAKVMREGSKETTDLALLSVDQSQLPYSFRLRRNPICKAPLQIGADVIVVYPGRVVRSKIISPSQIDPAYRSRFNTLINEPEGSGSGVFSSQTKCLFGIVSKEVEKKFSGAKRTNFAGYFVPAPAINEFISVVLHW
jgi:hypothetical protein